MTSRHHLLQNLPIDLNRISLSDWNELFDLLGLGSETKRKVYEGIFHQAVTCVDDLPGLSGEERQTLREKVVIQSPVRDRLLQSRDRSFKLTLRLHDGRLAETVLIQEWENSRLRKCSASISSQIGCFFGCSFCATGQMGFHRNLTTGELLAQVREAERIAKEELNTRLTHLYFMGMGEPMHNYRAMSDVLTIMRDEAAPGPPPDKITVSTVGLYRQIRMLAIDHPKVRLAVSVHSANQDMRYSIMPISARLSLPEIRDALVYHNRRTGNTATIQYLLLGNFNDRADDAEKLVSWLNGLPAAVTLIAYNNIPGSPAVRSDIAKIKSFQNILQNAKIPTDIRWCYGEDIDAGCGQLQSKPGGDRTSVSIRHHSGAVATH